MIDNQGAPVSDQGTMPIDRTLTPSELTYLIGTKYLPMAEITDPAILPAANAIKGTGDAYDLGARTISSALVALRDEGTISLEYVVAKKVRIFTSRHIMISKAGETGFDGSTLEHQLAATIDAGDAQSATTVLKKWFGPKIKHPADRACRNPDQRLRAFGLIVATEKEVERGRIAKAMSGKQTKAVVTAEANQALITEALPQVAAWSARWIKLLSEESELIGQLFEETKRFLKAMVMEDTDIDDI